MPLKTPRAPEAPSLSDVHKLIISKYSTDLPKVETNDGIACWFDDFMKTPSGKSARTRLQRSKSTYVRSLSILHIYSTVAHSVTESIPGMRHGYNFTTEQMCGADVWLHWKGNAAAIAAGMCMAHLVKIKAIGLVPHCTPSGKGSCKYRLPPADDQSVLGEGNSMNQNEILNYMPPLGGARCGAHLVLPSLNQPYEGV